MRLHEQVELLAAARSQKSLNKAGSPPPARRARKQQQQVSDEAAADGPIDSPVVKVRRSLVALAQQERKKQQKKRKAAEMTAEPEALAPSSGLVSPAASNGLGSAISAPDWPPVKASPALANGDAAVGAAKKRTRAKQRAANGRNAAPGAVQNFLRAGTKATLGLESWEDTEVTEKRQHDRLMHRAAPARRRVDEYDEEYDRGKVKKVKVQENGGSKLDSSTFDAAFKSQKANGISKDLQLRGKKKKMAERGEQQRGRGGGGQRGGRGGRGGNNNRRKR